MTRHSELLENQEIENVASNGKSFSHATSPV